MRSGGITTDHFTPNPLGVETCAAAALPPAAVAPFFVFDEAEFYADLPAYRTLQHPRSSSPNTNGAALSDGLVAVPHSLGTNAEAKA